MAAIPGPYSVAIASFEDPDSDGMTLKTLLYGYDTPESAHAAIPDLAKENNCKEDDLCVYQIIEKES